MQLIKYLILLSILSLCLGQFGAFSFGGRQANVYVTEILVFMSVLLSFFIFTAVKRRFKIPKRSRGVLLFVALAGVSLLLGTRALMGREFVVIFLYLLRFLTYLGLMLVVYNYVVSTGSVLTFLRGFLWVAIILSILGFLQLVIFPDFTQLAPSLGWDPHQNRLAATFFDPNFLGAFLVAQLILGISYLQAKVVYSRPVMMLVLTLLFVASILTFSRSAYLMFAVAIGILGLLRTRMLLLVALTGFLLAYLLIPRVQTRIAGGVDPDDSAQARFVSWGKTWQVIGENPITGVGFNAYRYAQERLGLFGRDESKGGRAGAGADSSLLFVWATTGIFGLFSYLVFVGDLLYSSWKLFRRTSPMISAVGLGSLAIIIGLLVESNFINSLFYPALLAFVMIYGGIIYALEDSFKR